MNGNHYLNARERELLAEGMFFGGWRTPSANALCSSRLRDSTGLRCTPRNGTTGVGAGRADEDAAEKGDGRSPEKRAGRHGRIEKSAAERAARAQAATVRRRDGRELQNLGDAPTVHRVGALDLRTRAGRDEDIRGSTLLVAVAQPLGRRPRATPAGTAAAVAVEGRMAGATAAGAHETVCLDDGWIYQGEGLNRRPHGLVKLTWPSGEMYSGTRVHGTRHGNGTCRDVEGGVYVGAYRNGERLGHRASALAKRSGLRGRVSRRDAPWRSGRDHPARREPPVHGAMGRGHPRKPLARWMSCRRVSAQVRQRAKATSTMAIDDELKAQILRYHSILVQRPQRDSGNERLEPMGGRRSQLIPLKQFVGLFDEFVERDIEPTVGSPALKASRSNSSSSCWPAWSSTPPCRSGPARRFA